MITVLSVNSITTHVSASFANNAINPSLVLWNQVSNIILNACNVLIVWPMNNKARMDHALNSMGRLIVDITSP